MQLIIIVFLAAILGFTYGSYMDGFIFSSKICLFAGLTLIMPSLFKFELSHVKLVWVHKGLMIKGMLVNFILLPLVAIGVGFVTGDFGITMGLFLVAVLAGGGMVMHWIKKSKGNTSFGFLLLFINLLLITLSLFMLETFATYSAGYFDESYDSEIGISRFVSAVIILLIVIPFIASRVIRFIKPLMEMIQGYQKYISQISIFIIIFYLFGLQNSQMLVDIYDFDAHLFFVAFVAVVAFYGIIFGLSLFIYDLKNPQEKALFWYSLTRYLTLALVIATFSVSSFGVSMLLPIMFAYIVQIPLSVFIAERYMKQN
jgi:predicted Na+-dependent transporter